MTAAAKLAQLGEVGAVQDLTAVLPTLASGELRTTVEVSILALQKRRVEGAFAQMRVLPQ